MSAFEYIAVDAAGHERKGVLEGDTARAVRQLLRDQGLLPVNVSEVAKQESARNRARFSLRRGLSPKDLALVTRQLATLVRAGVPLVESVAALTEQVENEQLVRVLTTVRESLNEGTSFAKSLDQHPKVFPPLYVNMIAAGEASGTLEAVLERLADFMEGQARLKGKVAGALAYPVLMAVVGTLLVGVLMVGVVPKVTSVFDNRLDRVPGAISACFSSASILASSAEKKTSAGAPSSIWRASMLEAPKLKVTVSPVCIW